MTRSDIPIYLLFSAANHQAIFKNVGIETVDYPYFDPKTVGLAFDGFVESLNNAPDRSVFLLHACAHNPTGVDPTPEQWRKISEVILAKGHFAFFDCAYQGFATGDLEGDASAVRYFEEKKVPMLVCQVGSCRYRCPLLHELTVEMDCLRVLRRMPGYTASELEHFTSSG